MTAQLREPPFEALPRPFQVEPSPTGPLPGPAVIQLVRSQVRALLESSAAYHSLTPDQRREMAANMEKIAAYSAALCQDEWAQSARLQQTPLVHRQTVLTPLPQARTTARQPLATAAADPPPADEFSPRAVSQIAGVTRETLDAIAFPTFVADLIKGTYSAIVDASIKQMEAYMKLLENVAGTVEQFMANNITDNQARDYLAAAYPEFFVVQVDGDKPAVRVRSSAEDIDPKPDIAGRLGLSGAVEFSDDYAEEVLVPAARRQLAQSRQQMLATMVMMGINRIVVTSGRIKAGMRFHIDARDTATAKSASRFDFRNETTMSASGGFFFGGFSASSKTTVAYVSTKSREATDELSAGAELNSEVEIKFKSDYFPMEKLATPQMLAAIQGNTSNPAAMTPTQQTGAQPQPAPTR